METTIDCAFVGEVRYRRPVYVKKIKDFFSSTQQVKEIKDIQKKICEYDVFDVLYS